MKQRFHYASIGYEAGLFLAVIIQFMTGWPFSALNVLGFFGLVTSVAVAQYQGKAPGRAEIDRPLSLIRVTHYS